jgi:hypothetical protein
VSCGGARRRALQVKNLRQMKAQEHNKNKRQTCAKMNLVNTEAPRSSRRTTAR